MSSAAAVLTRLSPERRRLAICLAAGVTAVAVIELLPRQRYSAALFLGICLVCAAVVASQLRGRSRDALLTIAALLFFPMLAEAVFATVAATPPPYVRYSQPFTRDDAVLGYAVRQSMAVRAVKQSSDGRTVFDVTYTTDQRGWRRTESNPDGPTIAFFFDSMTFGEGVEDGETLPQQLANLTGNANHVVNLGIPGYGPQAMLRTLETGIHDAVLGPNPAFFVVQTAAWHAERAACQPEYVWHTPRYALVDGAPVFQGKCADGLALWARRRLHESYLYGRLIEPLLIDRQRAIELYLAELRAAIRIAHGRYGARTIVLYYRSEHDQFAGTNFTDDGIIAAVRDMGAAALDVTRAEEGQDGLAILGDGHPSAKANRLRAALLWAAIQAEKPVGDHPGSAPNRP